ncbi:MAG: GNAT family N-acetyltransferase [Bacteroidota bacterium]
MEIRSLEHISTDELYGVFSEAFKDYERTWSRDEFANLLQRRGYVPDLSFGAFDGSQLVSFTLNALGRHKGILSAYDNGTGTLKEYRGKGLAKDIFTHSLPRLQDEGVTRYVLEVLQTNAPAIAVYKAMAFEVSRELCYFVQAAEKVLPMGRRLPSGYTLRNVPIPTDKDLADFFDFYPAWQNSSEALLRMPGNFVSIGAFDKHGNLSGYGCIEPATGDIPQLAVHKEHRWQGVGSCVLGELLKRNQSGQVRCINTEANCESINGFLQHHNIPVKGKQYEMIRDIG